MSDYFLLYPQAAQLSRVFRLRKANFTLHTHVMQLFSSSLIVFQVLVYILTYIIFIC